MVLLFIFLQHFVRIPRAVFSGDTFRFYREPSSDVAAGAGK